MSRKTIMGVIGFITVIFAFLKVQFGLEINPAEFFGGLGVIIAYLLFQGKMDIQKIGRQTEKFKSKKFWIAFITALVPAINNLFGINIPFEVVISIATFVLAILFGKEFKEANA